jgi:hypothetical protein
MSKYQQQSVLKPSLISVGEDEVVPLLFGAVMIDSTVEVATFSDGVPHDLGVLAFQETRTNAGLVFVTAHDDAGGRRALTEALFSVTRFGSGGPVAVAAIPVPQVGRGYYPDALPWNTITADVVDPSPSSIGVRVKGLAGVSIRWKVSVMVFGTQSK